MSKPVDSEYEKITKLKRKQKQGFPGDSVIKNLPANAGDTVASWFGKTPHVAEELSPGSTTEDVLQCPGTGTAEPVAHACGSPAPQPSLCSRVWGLELLSPRPMPAGARLHNRACAPECGDRDCWARGPHPLEPAR